jgi:Zn-dependent M16 (insulinase) family peptidase
MVILLTYLAGSSASVLENTLVEREQVASAVMFDFDSRPQTAVHFEITSVATESLERVEARFFEILKETAASRLDIGYMRDCIKREKRQVKFYAETSAQWFTESITSDFLFGECDGSTLRGDLENLQDYDALEAWTDTQWRHYLKTWMVEAPHVTVLGKPSALLSAKLESEENDRVEARRRVLGAQGLKELGQRLSSAKEENDIGIPKDCLDRFEIPSTKSISFINTTTARSGAARLMGHLANPTQELIDQDRDNPLFIHFEDMQSNFAYITLVLGTEAIPVPVRPLLAIYIEIFFSMPMSWKGTKISFEQVITELERDTVGYEIKSGAGLGNSETITIKLQVEAEKYQTAIQWLRRLMWSSVFDLERIKATTTRLLADIPEHKRDGESMVTSIELMIGTAHSSTARACDTLVKAVYLKWINGLLEKEPQTVIDQLKEVNALLCAPNNIRVLVSATIEKLQCPVSSWEILTDNLDNRGPVNSLDTRLSRLSDEGRNPGTTAYIIPMPPLDSSYLLAVSKGPTSFHDTTYPALLVATSYLSSLAGPLWVAIRSTGLAYGVHFSSHVDSGQVHLSIGSSPDPFKAFVASREVVKNVIDNADAFDAFTLEAAISSIISGLASAESTSADAAEASFVRQVMRGLPKEPSVIIERLKEVKVEEIRQAMKDILFPIFEPSTMNLFVTCAPIMERKTTKAFSEIGFTPEVKPLAFFQDDYGFNREDISGEESEEDSDDDMDDDSGEGSAED